MSRLNAPPRRAAGFSLVEMMIALVLGTLLMAGLVQVFAASRAAYSTSEGMSRTQENGRFAMDNLLRDVRMAGHFGCVSDQARLLDGTGQFVLTYAPAQTEASYNTRAWPLQFHVSMQGYEANGTAPGNALALLAAPAVAGPTGGGNWTPALPGQLPTRAIRGSDVIVLRYVLPESVPVTVVGTAAAPTISYDEARWDVLRAGVTNPGLFAITDCKSATVFTGARSAGGGSIIANTVAGGIGFTQAYEAGAATLHRAESVAYYVGLGASGQPALFRCRALSAIGDCTPEELVEGVENLQFIYGQGLIASNGRPSGYINAVRTAGAIGDASATPAAATNWRLVGAVQVGMVVRSPNTNAGDVRTTPFSVLGVAITPPAGDSRTRASYENSITLRNRLYGN